MANARTFKARTFEARTSEKEFVWVAFEGIKLKLADKTYYTPDFFLMRSDGTLECHEVKGHWEDDARVKIKCAAEKFPFRFVAIKATREGYKEEEI